VVQQFNLAVAASNQVKESQFLSELSDLRITADNLKTKLNRETDRRKEMELQYKQRIVEHQTQFEIFRTSKVWQFSL